MIAPWPPGSEPPRIKAGFALYHVDGRSQHAGIAEDDADFNGTVEAYAAARRSTFRERWNGALDDGRPSQWRVNVFGWVEHPEDEPIEDRVLMECESLMDLLRDKRGNKRQACCWQIGDGYQVMIEEDTSTVVFRGSCAGFVEHCYTMAGVDLVQDRNLLATRYEAGESEEVYREYERAEGKTIKRLYPSYQIRAFQEDTYPWEPDIAFRWFPENFDK